MTPFVGAGFKSAPTAVQSADVEFDFCEQGMPLTSDDTCAAGITIVLKSRQTCRFVLDSGWGKAYRLKRI